MRLKDQECAVIEMGMNEANAIDYLSKITKPHIAVITNVGTAHIGNLGSRENILKAKLEIKNGLVDGGTLVINNDNDLLHKYYLENNNNILTIGITNKSDIMATDIQIDNSKAIYNSLIAFAIGILTNVPLNKIINGIQSFKLTKGRIEIIEKENNITIINDSYNASLDSMKSSLQLLASHSGDRKIAILGSMFELGEFSKELHQQVGKIVLDNKIDILITVGDEAKYIANEAKKKMSNNVYSFTNNKEAVQKIKEIIKPNDTILIKASNGMRFNEIVKELV